MIKTINGNVFDSTAQIIAHQVNLYGVMGAGIAFAIKKMFPNVYTDYAKICLDGNPRPTLGTVQVVATPDEERYIANMFTQNKSPDENGSLTNYEAIRSSFKLLLEIPELRGLTVAIPYNYGCGIANGDWNTVYGILTEVFDEANRDLEIWKFDR